MSTIGVAIIGCGGITLQNHIPGLALCPDVKVVALCDANLEVLERARQVSKVEFCLPDYREVLKRDDVHAVINTNHDHDFGGDHQESFIKWEGTKGVIIAKMGLLMNYPHGVADKFEFCLKEDHGGK